MAVGRKGANVSACETFAMRLLLAAVARGMATTTRERAHRSPQREENDLPAGRSPHRQVDAPARFRYRVAVEPARAAVEAAAPDVRDLDGCRDWLGSRWFVTDAVCCISSNSLLIASFSLTRYT